MTTILATFVSVMIAQAGQSVDPGKLKPLDPVAVQVSVDGRASIDLPGGRSGRDYLIVLGSPLPGEDTVEVRFNISTADRAAALPVADRTPDRQWLARVGAIHQKMADKRLARSQNKEQYSTAKFAEQKSFHLYVQEHDLRDAAGYQEVRAKLAAVGKHCLVYVDLDDKPDEYPQTALDDIIATFDGRVYPTAGNLFGRHTDVDRNGKFTILVTHWLNQLSGGKVSLGGFVRGGDFYRDLPAPFSNQCDMMYLNSKLRRGSHLENIIAHEYTHAITFCEHVFGDYLPANGGEDEESWLNEAISHLAENLMGSGWSNLDYRVSAFLNNPAAYRLVVPDYYRAGLWRCAGSRGSTFLFLRYCVDRFGIDVLRRLSQSNLNGIANVEQATLMPFDELFRDWSATVALAGLAPAGKRLTAESTPGSRPIPLVGQLGRRLLAGPRQTTLSIGSSTVRLSPTSFSVQRVEAPAGATLRIELAAPSAARVQATVIRLPDDLPKTALAISIKPNDPQISNGEELAPTINTAPRRVIVAVQQIAGEPVHWQQVSWESLSPPSTRTPEVTKGAEIIQAAEVFASTSTRKNQTLYSDPLDLSKLGDDRLIFKLIGIDRRGRKVSAWAELER